MLPKLREQLEDREEGFTLIELLVVVIIIGILAAIAIPVFLNQRESAWRSSAAADARNAALGVESFATRYNVYPATGSDLTSSTAPTFTAAGVHNNTSIGDDAVETSDGVTLTYTFRAAADASGIAGEAGTYCIVANHANITGTTIDGVYDSSNGGIQTGVTVNPCAD